jgi:hypothetical protein
MKLATVITTINDVNDVMKKWSNRVSGYGPLVVVADKKTPDPYKLDRAKVLSHDSSEYREFTTAGRVPHNNYARKNLGYLWAMKDGAQCIYETDDDNAPLDGWALRPHSVPHTQLRGPKVPAWFNTYSFLRENAWPRGFPLELVKKNNYFTPNKVTAKCSIQQGMIRGDSDVDAIYRMTHGGDLEFKDTVSFSLNGLWSPFNSQSTWWWPSAYALMYLPSTCSMRVTDIWRSFVAQRCLREIGESVLYHSPAEVVQERNKHNLLDDLKQEVPLYTSGVQISTLLDSLKLAKGHRNVMLNMVMCYVALTSAGLLDRSELYILNGWTEDIGKL